MTRSRLALAILAIALSFIAAPEADLHLRAAATLARFGGDGPATLAAYGELEFEEELSEVAGRPLRSYRPVGEANGHLVLAHGMHPLGFDEPRLVELASVFAASGLVVHTPDQPHLKALSLDPVTATELTETMRALSRREQTGPLGVLGISFAGGLALCAASADPSVYAFVVPVGAHHDLSRVVRWFAGDRAVGPQGSEVTHAPHPYGVGLLVHASPERFFPPAEAQAADAALSLALHDHGREADVRAEQLSSVSRRVLDEARRPSSPTLLGDDLLKLLADERETFDAASPRGRLATLSTPVMILHGAEDPIVPSTEARYMAEELPPSTPLLISNALRHAETAEASLVEKLTLVHFVARVLAAADAT